MSSRLASLFPEGTFQHQMGFQRGDFAQFFGPTEQHAGLIAQRRHWLDSDAGKYAALVPGGEALLEETIDLAVRHKTLLQEESSAISSASSDWEKCLAMGQAWEPDFLLLARKEDASFRLLAGAVCFPSSWSLEEKVGHPLEVIHAPVPNLNLQLGTQIHTFLSRLRPGAAWLRTNWGLSASAELNQHPSRNLPSLTPPLVPGSVWLRVEHQALVVLPNTGGVLFGIRIAVHSLGGVMQDQEATQRLVRSLETMPEEVAAYKRIAQVRPDLIRLLRSEPQE